jgi:hypothetical protein
MADDDLQILTKALKVLIEMRHDWAKAIAAGYKRGETETAIKGMVPKCGADAVVSGRKSVMALVMLEQW